MTSTTRVPPTEITGIFGTMAKRFSKKKLGQVPESLGVMWHNRPVLRTLIGFSRKAEKWDACDTPAEVVRPHGGRVAGGLQRSAWTSVTSRLTTRSSTWTRRARCRGGASPSVFTPLERDVLEYAEAMTQTPPAVTDELSERLLDQLGAPALVELTAIIAAANMVSRANVALGIESQGFSAACGLPPLATPAPGASPA